MKIAHAAIYTEHLETLRDFYCRWFGGSAGPRYENPKTGFSSYFVRFESGAALELMTVGGLAEPERREPSAGYTHVAFSTDSRRGVEDLTARMEAAGVEVVGGPRETGDGYYESCVLDPDGNRVEITC